MFGIGKKKQCFQCEMVFSKKDNIHILKVSTNDGEIDLPVCDVCVVDWEEYAQYYESVLNESI